MMRARDSSSLFVPKRFTEEQLYEIHKGEELSLPVDLYSNPHYTPREMVVYRTMLETASLSQAYPNHRYVVTDYGPEEITFGFKSESNYEKYPDRVCYIPENWDFDQDGSGYTANDILELCGGDKDKADMVFALCDWQHPSTILDGWDADDSLSLVDKKQQKIQKLEGEIQEIRNQLQQEKSPSLSDRISAADQRKIDGSRKITAFDQEIHH